MGVMCVHGVAGKSGREYLPESAGACRHDEYRDRLIFGKVIKDLLPARMRALAIDPCEGYRLLLQVPCDQI
jgi:hypothetical protein